MTPPLFLRDSLPADDTVELGGDEGHHAAHVRRLSVGETALIGDGRGTVLECVVSAVVADGLRLRVRSRRQVARPLPRLVVVQALPKGDRGELAVEMMTELGVDEIVPWAAAHSITRWSGARAAKALERWRRTAREAAKQSRRAWLPEIAALASTDAVAARLRAGTGLVLDETAATALASAALPAPADCPELVVVVGPEGGISPAERAQFAAAGAIAVRLGDAVLRTSTAGAAALAALSIRLGRWA